MPEQQTLERARRDAREGKSASTTGSNSVFAGGGTALVVHAKADDMKSDPAGNAGDRIACGLITK